MYEYVGGGWRGHQTRLSPAGGLPIVLGEGANGVIVIGNYSLKKMARMVWMVCCFAPPFTD